MTTSYFFFRKPLDSLLIREYNIITKQNECSIKENMYEI